MGKKRSVSESASTIPKGIGISLIISAISTLIGIAVSAYMIHKEMISQEGAGIAAILVLFLGSTAGTITAIKTIKRMKMQMCLLSAAAYLLLLLSVTALFFGGQYQGILTAVSAVVGGSGIAVISIILTDKRGNRFRRKTAYR